MEIKTYRAGSMQEALALVRHDLGPEAAVLHTREVNGSRLLRWIPGLRKIEVTASRDVNVAPRMPQRAVGWATTTKSAEVSVGIAHPTGFVGTAHPADEIKSQLSDLQAQVAALCQKTKSSGRADVPQELFQVYTDLIESDIAEDLARELIERLRSAAPRHELADPEMTKARLAGMIEADISVAGPIRVTAGRRRVAALVGPTGVGKTTTIAKLAANFRLREKRRVGLITVDTYRIAAVEQLRTYADIIDLPMQVVSTPREMREAVARMADLDLILMDTAGRSPRDEVKLNELKMFLGEAQADEVHLVLSSVAGAATLQRTAEKFAEIGTTALVLTKLDEATGLGNLLPLLRSTKLPLSYVTNGQNVPDDIAPAEPYKLARLMLDVAAA